ncbi:TPA: phage tail protein, partial [Citrobacter freundii]|nr:phage tail protein [Citrobacter freundii]HBM8420900.1 phage tail protein [Citrobacter freundii]HBM9413686.1 phage tail protein [Citrobacter freundii]HBM9423679.1 phage tail protein [Citrobacter freundii]HBM9433522.1 phage tail protein [Citrobacter freundii]
LDNKADKSSLGTAAGKNVGTATGDVVTAGSVQDVYKTAVPATGYTDMGNYGLLSDVSMYGDSVAKLTQLHVNTAGWALRFSVGAYNDATGSAHDAGHLLMSTDGGTFNRRWYLLNNGILLGPTGTFYSEG